MTPEQEQIIRLEEQVNGLRELFIGTATIKTDDHERRLRALEKFMWSVPISAATAAGSVVLQVLS